MRTLLITTVASLFLFQGVYSQTQQEQMTAIDKTQKEIKNNISSYQKTEQRKAGTTSKLVYMDGCDLKLVSVEVTENDIDKKVNLYFSNGVLIYADQIGTDIWTGNIVDNERTYLNNSQVISWIKTGNKEVDNSSKKFKVMNNKLQAYALQLEKDSEKADNYPVYSISLAKK